jgi:hypothetical protein
MSTPEAPLSSQTRAGKSGGIVMQEWLGGGLTPSVLFLEARKRLRLTKMCRVVRELKRRGVNLGALHALEMFGGTGGGHTVDYAPYVASLEVWEVQPTLASVLHKNLPHATIEIVDSFAQLELTKKKFDLVVVDPPYEMFNGYCEHFELLPGVFRILNTFAILILNIRLEIVVFSRYSDEHFERRRAFYHVKDPTSISLERMIKVYKDLASQHGFEVKWWFAKDRVFMYPLRKHSVDRDAYLILALQMHGGR